MVLIRENEKASVIVKVLPLDQIILNQGCGALGEMFQAGGAQTVFVLRRNSAHHGQFGAPAGVGVYLALKVLSAAIAGHVAL